MDFLADFLGVKKMTSKSKTVSLPLASGRKKKFFLERIKGVSAAYAPNSSVAKVFIDYEEKNKVVFYQISMSVDAARGLVYGKNED